MIDTAGHCVSDGAGHFHTNWIFVPAYSSAASGCLTTAGCFPYGKWTARRLATTTEWHNFSNLKQDYGYAVLNTLGGQHIVNRLGGQGSRFNQSRTQTFRAYGYPQAAPFNGFDQKVCVSNRLANDNPSARPGPLTMKISCNMTGGSSGGGWLIAMATSGLGYVNSHNSYGYVGQPGFMFVKSGRVSQSTSMVGGESVRLPAHGAGVLLAVECVLGYRRLAAMTGSAQ